MSPLSFIISKFKVLRNGEKNSIHRMVLTAAIMDKVWLSFTLGNHGKTSLRFDLPHHDIYQHLTSHSEEEQILAEEETLTEEKTLAVEQTLAEARRFSSHPFSIIKSSWAFFLRLFFCNHDKHFNNHSNHLLQF